MTPMTDDGMFRELNNKEALEFRNWARENYEIGSPISSLWHPIVRDECDIMNLETSREADNIVFNEDDE